MRNAAKDGKKGAVVSVKSSKQKRKAGPTAAEVYEEASTDSRKRAKKGRKSG